MAYPTYDSRYSYIPSHESSRHTRHTRRDTDTDADEYSTRAMRRTTYTNAGSYHSTPSYYTYETRVPSSAARSRNRWPPPPSVEDESASLTREVLSPSPAGSSVDDAEAKTRGSVDQYPIIEEIEQPANDERRFVIVSDPLPDAATPKDSRRRSFAERANIAPLKTDLDTPPLYPERISTPYAYTRPQKESLAPSSSDYFLSPETIAPSSPTLPPSVPLWSQGSEARNQNSRPTKQVPIRPKPATSSRPPSPTKRDDVFEDSDSYSDAAPLRTERRPARYSFVKNDLPKEHFRPHVQDDQPKSSERTKRDASPPNSARRRTYGKEGKDSLSSSASSKQRTPPSDSPTSSSSSLNGESRKFKPAPLDTHDLRGPKYSSSSRPSSPRRNNDSSPPRSPRLPPRRPPSPNVSGSSPRSARPSSPNLPPRPMPEHSPRVNVTEADWHATYPPAIDRSRPSTRPERYETMPAPMPHINVKSPSPARAPRAENPLPYPVDDSSAEAFMPPEEQFQHDHSYFSYTPISPSLRSDRFDSSAFGSTREPQTGFHRPQSSRKPTTDDVPRSPRVRSNSVLSQDAHSGIRKERRSTVPLSLDRPLPSCPRAEPSSMHTDWFTLQDFETFDICPSCYEGVFADTPFSRYFTQRRRYERPVERFCDFSSPWVRLAWLLTIKQRRQTPDLIYTLATISDQERPCPGDRELGVEHTAWYGIADPRDGVHVANFALCPCDLRMMEELFPTMKGYFTRIPASVHPYAPSPTYTCSLRVNSRRFPKYLDLLVELDAEAQALNQHPHISRFVQLAREYAFKDECQRDKLLLHKMWHFIPTLPELTVCQECFDELIWPYRANQSSSSPSTSATIPRLFTMTVQPVPGEDPELGSSCCLYSPRMRSVFESAVRKNDLGYLERKVLERKSAEVRLGRERRDILAWMDGLERGTWEWEKAKVELKENEDEWRACE